MIRILHFAGIINRYDMIDSVLARLDRSKFELSALTSTAARRVGSYDPGQQYPVKVLNFEFKRLNYVRMLLALHREVRLFRPHILHAHHYEENVIASVVARAKRVPCYVIGRHYSDHIYYLTRGLKRRVLIGVEGACNVAASRVVVPSQEVARILTERQGVPDRKVVVIPYTLELSRYRRPSESELNPILRDHGLLGKYVVLASCRLSREKGLQHLLMAMPEVLRSLQEVRLVILGSGPYESALRQLSGRLGLDGVVRFMGWQDNPVSWMAAADLVVQPSLCESFCQVLIEALSVGTPVVMTPVGAGPEVIGANERGRLVPLADSGALAKAIVELARNPGLGRVLGERGQAYVRQNMDPDGTAKRHEAVYERALEDFKRCH